MNKTRFKSLRQAAEAYEAVTFAGRGFDQNRIPQLAIPSRRQVSKVQAAVSPDCTYRLIKAALGMAKREICLYIYNISAPYLLDLLSKAKAKGVRVRIMYDVKDSGPEERKLLDELGVEVKEAPSTGNRKVFTVCHQKFAVIDSAIVLLGSANWVKSAIPQIDMPGTFRKGNREWVVRLDSRSLARWFRDLFEADWEIPEVVSFEVPEVWAIPEALLMPVSFALVPDQIFDILNTDLPAPAKVTPIISPDNYFELCRKLIQDAHISVDIEQQYIRAGGPQTEGLLGLLQQRKDQLEIRIITSPVFPDPWENTLESMKAYGLDSRHRAMNLRLYTHLHNKGVIVDRKKVIVSSTNWSENSLAKAREAGVLIESPQIAEYFAGVFDFDWEIAWQPGDVKGATKALFEGVSFSVDEMVEIDPADML
jgi:phosphatidylserine/phosphatidylglycerophosphate/cardiolipin synthase-like enzyme